MKTVAAISAALTLASPAWALPPDTAPGAELVFLLCQVSPQQTSRDCRFYTAINDPAARLKAASELVYLDAHPFPIVGARPGERVKVMVRLSVSQAGDGFAVAASPQPAPSSAPPIRHPQWIEAPQGVWSRAFTRSLAARANQSGEAKVSCLATDTGAMTDCWVRSESPVDAGFGEAALVLMQHARMKVVGADGAAVAGRAFVDTVNFEGDGRASTSMWPAPGGSTGMAMGMMSPH